MKIFEKRLVSFLLALIIVVGMLPPVSLDAKAETTGLEGKTISILGDSISTYQNYSNGTAAGTTNSTITNGAIYYPRSGFDVTADSTWWYQAAQELGMDVLVNNSWSGSCLLNTRSGTVGAYVDRCVQLHDDTGDNAGQEPDIIAIFLGTNDYYTYPGTLGSYESIAFDTLITKTEAGYAYAEPATSMEAYAIILHKIAQRYPKAEVYCFTLLPRVNSTSQPTAVNEDIRQLANHFGAITVDLHNCGIQPDSTHMGDNLHPNSAGMDAMTNAFVSAVLKNSGEMTYRVSFNLDGVVAMEGTTRTVIAGDEFRATLKGKTGNRQLNVSVKMGGADITEACYVDGVVQIPAVNGDVVITASLADRDPLNFRWEYDAQKNALVSGSSDGNTENALTMTSGSITDGKFSKVKYTLDEAVILKHDKPWAIEWKSSGTWTDTTDGALLLAGDAASSTADKPYLYRRHNSDFIAFGVSTGGQYHNYGVKLGANGIDGTIDHTYKLENRINADGSNMVYLYVDDQEIGPMNHHWIGGTDKKETVDWLNGQDLVFTHMGTSPHTIGNCYIDYIQVWENGAKHVHAYKATVTAPTCTEQGYTTYTCDCGDSYVDDYVDADGHDFTDWYMTREATYEQAGEESRDCKKCSHVEFRPVELAVVTSGNVGYGTPYTDAVTYTLYADGTMVIAGSGRVYCSDWRGNNQPYYAYRDQVKNLIIEEGITQTSGGCFAYFVNLERVSFPDSLVKINKNAFMNSFVSSMTSITIPATVTYLADYAFGFYSGSASATFTDVIIENPNASFHASNAVFNSGKKLQNLTLYSYGAENNVRTYAETYGCRYVDLNNYMEGDFGDVHYELSNGVLVLEALVENAEIAAEKQPWASMVDKITKIVISDGVTTIADNAFANYTALTEVELPHGLEVIGDGVFAVSQSNNTSLTMALPRRLTAVGEDLFAGRSNVSLTVYYGSLGADITESGVTLDIQKVFKILLIGNSFSEDASNAGMPNSQMLDILQAMLGEDAKITVGLCYSGGKGLNWHATQSEQGNSSYSLRVISTESGAWKNYGSYTSAKALTWTDWDVVSLQHYEINTTTGKESNAYSDQVDPKFDNLKSATEFMLDYVDAYAPDATVYFYMHWSRAYKANLNESLAEYNKMAAFFPVVMDYAGPESNQTFEGIIPVGLAVQNARTTYLATLSYNSEKGITVNMQNDPQIGLQRDGGHMTYNVGRYIAALTFAETIIPEDMRAEGYVLPEIRVTESVGKLPTQYSIIAQKSVLAAVNSWKNGSLAVTNIEGYTEDPTVAASETLKKLPLELNCGDAEALVEQIRTTVLSALPADFAVDVISVDTETQTASLTIRFGYTSVVVEMGYTLSAHSYENGVCTICGQKEPVVLHSYRWEIENNTMVSVATNGNTVNDLTLTSGSITGGALKNVRYSLNKAVNLYHDVPWVIEWRSSGNWDGMLLASNLDTAVNGTTYLFRFASMNFLALGDHTNTWNNYGLIHEIDMSGPHLFRLENRIGADGTNTVYLLVDGVEIDAMHHYYNSGTNQNQIVNWANGRDLVFGNIGTSSHPVNNMQLEYLQIWENGHNHDYRSAVTAPTCTEGGYTTYTCDCGSSYVGDYVDTKGHSYENGSCKVCGAMASNPYAGKTIACIGDSITAAYGVTKDKTDYVKLLADRLEMSYIRLGASGTSLCANGGRVCNIDKLTESKLQGADVVTIAMGINDFCGAGAGYYKLGDIHSTDSSTIYGAVRMWCERIVELRKTDSLKDTQFYFMTPLITSWNNSVTSARNWDQSKVNIHGYTLRDLCNAIIEVAALYDVAVIDMNLISGLYYVSAEDNNIDVFGGDGVHPGDEGHAMMAAALEDMLLERYLLDDHDHSYGSWITTTYPDCEGGEEKRVCGICRATESRALPAIPTEENVHLSQKAKLQPDGSFTFTLEIYASEKVALYEDAVIRYVLNQGFVMTEKSEVKAVRVSELLSDAVLNENKAEAEDLIVRVNESIVDVTGFDLSKEYISDEHSGSKLVITISNVEATDDVIWGEHMDISTADSGIWADGAMAVAFAKSSAFFHESVYVMDYAEEITLDGENIIHLDADGMGGFTHANVRLEMTYGTVQIENGCVVYIPDTMQWNGYDRFYAFAGQNEDYQWAKMAVIPANNVYYEDSCIAISAEEAAQGAGIYYTNGTKPEDVAQDVWDCWCGQWESVSDNKTGNSVENSSDVQGWIENLAGQTGFTGGSAHLVQAMLGQSGNSVPKATFTFTGTGVDIYSFTNNTTGTVMVQVSDVKGIYPSSYYIVDTGANTAEGYYQVPTISFVGKGHSTYQVTIMVTTGAASKNRFAFYLDGIRVYNPLAEDAKDTTVEDAYGDEMQAVFGSVRQMLLDAGSFTGETGEGTGFVFLDRLPESENAGNTNVIGTYAVYGPKNEVYLAKGQAIAFKVDETLYSRVQVGLKSLTGEEMQAVVSYFDEESDAAAQGMVSISHTADLYYELMPIEGYVVIRNTSDAILAVTKVKLMVSGDPQQISAQVEKVSQAEVLEAVDEFDALPMMTYRLRNFQPDVEITQPEVSPEELAMAQMRALIEKIFGSVRKWFD